MNDSDTALYFVSGVLAKGLSAKVGGPFFFRYGKNRFKKEPRSKFGDREARFQIIPPNKRKVG